MYIRTHVIVVGIAMLERGKSTPNQLLNVFAQCLENLLDQWRPGSRS